MAGVTRSQHSIHRTLRKMLRTAARSKTCQRCRASRTTTCSFCPRCRRRLCRRCNPVDDRPITPFQTCSRCLIKHEHADVVIRSRSTARMRRALTKTLLSMEREVLRSTTRTQVLRGLADLQKYGDLLGQLALPATELSVANYLVFSVTCREPDTLDSSTVLNYAQGQSL